MVNNNSYKFTAPMGFGGVRRAVSDGINDFWGVWLGGGGGVRFEIKIYLGYNMQP